MTSAARRLPDQAAMHRTPSGPRRSFAFAAGWLALALAACSQSHEDPAKPVQGARADAPTQAQAEAFVAEGAEPALRRLRPLDYVLHYALMQATGMDRALGGEAQAIAALRALGEANEKTLRGEDGRLPRMVPAAFTGAGMDTGLIGVSLAALPMMLANLGATSRLANMTPAELDAAIARGQQPLDGGQGSGEDGQATVEYHENSISTTVQMDADTGTMKGTTKTRVRMDMCPDPSGQITIDVEIQSQMALSAAAGTGGTVRASMHVVRHVDDDAQLIDRDEGYRQRTRMTIAGQDGGDGGHLIDITLDPLHGDRLNRQQGLTIFDSARGNDAVALAQATEKILAVMVDIMLRGMGEHLRSPPWESGHCVVLKPTTNPGKRTGARPGTTYDIEAAPRAKSDGAPTGGTVRATLDGASRLQPQGKVQADAKFAYANPEKKNERASIAFEARSRRGVGRATLRFDTRRAQPYLAKGGLDEFHGVGIICDLAQPFTISGGGNTVRFTPTGDDAGTYEYSGTMRGIGVHGNGTWSATADERGGTLKGTGNGCVVTPMGTRCAGGTEVYALTPMEACPDGE